MHRHKLSKGKSGHDFTKYASRTHKFNVGNTSGPMRGGIRL
ncbi:MAG: hypothetical protein [Microvirus sp.]|nr:MAG: hypothetical protein [Microvirus sp.]